jgi:hypothetical protein
LVPDILCQRYLRHRELEVEDFRPCEKRTFGSVRRCTGRATLKLGDKGHHAALML